MHNPISLDSLNSEISYALFESPSSFAIKVHALTLQMMDEMSLDNVLAMGHLFRSSTHIDSFNTLFVAGAVEAIITEVRKAKMRQDLHSSARPDCTPLLGDIEQLPTMPLERSEGPPEISLKNRSLRRRGKLQGTKWKALRPDIQYNPQKESDAHSQIHVLRLIYSDENSYSEENKQLLATYQNERALEGIQKMFLIISRQQSSAYDKKSPISLHETLTDANDTLLIEGGLYDQTLSDESPPEFLRMLNQKQTTMQKILELTKALYKKGIGSQEDLTNGCDKITKEAGEDLMKAFLQETGVDYSQVDEEMPDECKIS